MLLSLYKIEVLHGSFACSKTRLGEVWHPISLGAAGLIGRCYANETSGMIMILGWVLLHIIYRAPAERAFCEN